ncbi:MAG: hypothetical protein JEZ00_02450 [Anaerolineaceae bacterium]|nr:hypothetical protein [Anaerolineaceae bacterium]
MTSRSVRDGVFLVGGFHYFMAGVILLGTAGLFVFSLLPPMQNGTVGLTQNLFLPFTGIILGLILCGMYAIVGAGLIRLKNSSRMTAIFLSGLGLMGGFIAVLGTVGASVFGNPNPNWLTITLIGAGTICFYAIVALMDIFILFFLFNKRVREVFYAEEWATNIAEQDALGLEENPQLMVGLETDESEE